MSHEALGKTNENRSTYPNVWFVGVTPRRNPELVVAVLWEHGEFSYYPARIGAEVVAAYVQKQRRLANNLMQTKAPPAPPKPVEVGAVWTTPGAAGETARLHAGRFFVNPNSAQARVPRVPVLGPGKAPSQLGLALPTRRIQIP